MPNSFTTSTTTGYGTRIGKSFVGVLLGIVMFFGSFVLLFWNEGRTDLSSIAKTAIELPAGAASTDAAVQGKLVSASGVVTSNEELTDDLYLQPGKYLAVDRKAEMYAWVETKSEKSHTNVGGSETTDTTYDYAMEWTSDPQPSTAFQYPEDHENPDVTVPSDTFTVGTLTVGAYEVTGDVDLPPTTPLSLKKDLVALGGGAKLSGDYVFLGTGTVMSPKLGDTRISYSVLNAGFDGTVFGKLASSKITKSVDADGNELFRVFPGSRDEAIATLHSEFVTMGWVWRVVGFLLMWFGLAGVLGPISTLLDILPFLGSTSRFLVSVVTFPIALVLTVVTVLISMVLHSLIALIIVLALCIGGGIAAAKLMPKKTGATV